MLGPNHATLVYSVSVPFRINKIPLFFATKENNVGCIKKLLSCASTNVFERGAVLIRLVLFMLILLEPHVECTEFG